MIFSFALAKNNPIKTKKHSMNLKRKVLSLVTMLIVTIHFSYAQKWVQMMQDPNANFYEVQKEQKKCIVKITSEQNSKNSKMIQKIISE